VTRDEHEALYSVATWVHGLVLGGSDEMPFLAVAMSPSPSPELIEGQANAVAINGV
jgi:hypothetical protein